MLPRGTPFCPERWRRMSALRLIGVQERPLMTATSGEWETISNPDLRRLWDALLDRINLWNADWYARLTNRQSDLREPSPGARPISDPEAFEAFTLALLSGNTRWDRIESVRKGLDVPFLNFDPRAFADTDDDALDHVAAWFRERRAGAPRLRASLVRLRQTAALLSGGGQYRNSDDLITSAFAASSWSTEHAAMLLGTSPRWKLPGFGVALAAEALRNLRFDLCKPDRHVVRAVAAWDLVPFPKWDRRSPYTAPTARPGDLLAAMLVIRRLAEANDIPVTHSSSAVWTAGAVSGARLTNKEFADLKIRH